MTLARFTPSSFATADRVSPGVDSSLRLISNARLRAARIKDARLGENFFDGTEGVPAG